MKDFDKRTTLVIDWEKSRGGHGMALDEQGDKMPREIRISVINTLLRGLGEVRVQVER